MLHFFFPCLWLRLYIFMRRSKRFNIVKCNWTGDTLKYAGRLFVTFVFKNIALFILITLMIIVLIATFNYIVKRAFTGSERPDILQVLHRRNLRYGRYPNSRKA